MRNLLLLLPALLICLACGQSDKRKLVEQAPFISKTFVDGTGRTLQLPKTPTKIISLAPNITEILFALSAEDMLVARSEACDFPQSVDQIDAITTYPELDIEQIQALEADLIISTSEVFGEQEIALLEDAGQSVYLQTYTQIADLYTGIRQLGELLGKGQAGMHLADSLQQLEERIVQATENQIKYGTMLVIGDDPITTIGGTGILHDLIGKAGGRNVFANIDSAFFTPTEQAFLTTQPEFLIFPAKNDQVYLNFIAQHPALYNTPADVSKQVYILDPDILFRPGPRLLDGLLELTHTLHNKLNREAFVEE